MSPAGCVDEGVVTQDDTTINDGNDSLDAGYMTDTDPDVRAGGGDADGNTARQRRRPDCRALSSFI
jgi:hypothetical protein